MNESAKLWNLYQVYKMEKDDKDPDLTFEDFRTVFLVCAQEPSPFGSIVLNTVMEKYKEGNREPGKHRKEGN